MTYDNTRLCALLRSIRTSAGAPHDQIEAGTDPRYAFALGLIWGIAHDALGAVAENRPLNIQISLCAKRRSPSAGLFS